jgi:ubiquitin-activating enzyme E1
VLKACSGKFGPIQQMYYFAAPEILPVTSGTGAVDLSEFTPQNSRYDHMIAIVGKSVQKQIAEQRYFLIGAGAIGCEMLKCWSLVCSTARVRPFTLGVLTVWFVRSPRCREQMGMATAGKGQVFVTDMDMIEKSNLNRQFLFRPADVGKLKVRMRGACGCFVVCRAASSDRGPTLSLTLMIDSIRAFGCAIGDRSTRVLFGGCMCAVVRCG